MKKNKYENLINLGFKREDQHDNVVFQQTGHYPYYLIYTIKKGVEYYVHDDNLDEIELIISDKNANVLARHVVTLEEVTKTVNKAKRK